MRISWKKTFIVTSDVLIAIYLLIAFTAFNKPDEAVRLCTKVNINIQDEATNGFIDAREIKARLEKEQLYPLEKPMKYVNLRKMEEALKASPFVKTAECYKTEDGEVNISLTQRMPVVRIKAANGDDYYLDDNDCIMPNSHYTSDLIIATGNINKWFASNYISPLSKALMGNELWCNQIEQINVLSDLGVELIPRVGNHIVYLGQMPFYKNKEKRKAAVVDFVNRKMNRLEKFYKYGLSQAGWNRYSYINLEFDNQIICKRRDKRRDDNESLGEALAASDVIGNVEAEPKKEEKPEPSAAESPTKAKEEPQKVAEKKSEKPSTSSPKAKEEPKKKAEKKSEKSSTSSSKDKEEPKKTTTKKSENHTDKKTDKAEVKKQKPKDKSSKDAPKSKDKKKQK